ncbi:MobF family relaxase [Hyphococcus sp.]|uniref:MobF family relaxase n=1 Tax=Hyphococcus sp. TaxID=2038636 RepID=UPI0035C6E091
MVASISVRKSVAAAAAYYQHMGKDDYYAREGEAPGRWEGRAAERLSLEGSVSKSDFEAALEGLDPRTGERLILANGIAHTAGWDMTFSAPKSASVLWALSNENARQTIEAAHQKAVNTALIHLENNHAWARRGRRGAIKERTAGLLVATFDHHTSRDLDPQLHTHAFIFNLAPRHDGSWGAIVGRELYLAQKEAGRIYRTEFANGLERSGINIIRETDSFRVTAIPMDVERAFSKRREAIENAAETYGYSSAKGMEMAALRTRKPKQEMNREALLSMWREEAKTLGFDLNKQRIQAPKPEIIQAHGAQYSLEMRSNLRPKTAQIQPEKHAEMRTKKVIQPPNIARLLQRLAATLDGPSRMSGICFSLRQKERNLERE